MRFAQDRNESGKEKLPHLQHKHLLYNLVTLATLFDGHFGAEGG